MAALPSMTIGTLDLSSRELFAAVAMHALMVCDGTPVQVDDLVSAAVEVADLLIEKLGSNQNAKANTERA